MAQGAQTTQDATPTPPAGYNLITSNSPVAPKVRPLADLMKKASSRAPIIPPKGYRLLDPAATKAISAIRKRNQDRPSISAAPEPSAVEQLRQSVANTAIGHSVEEVLPKLADALNLHPTETVNSPTYQQHKEQLLAPEYAASTIAENSPVPLTQAGQERLEGALKGVGGLTSAPNLALMGGTSIAAGLTAGVINPVSAQYLSRAVSGGFTLDMLYGLYQHNKAYKQAVDRGDLTEAHRIQGEMGLDAITALLGAKHTLAEHPAILESPVREEEKHAERTEQEPHRAEGSTEDGHIPKAVPELGDVWHSAEAGGEGLPSKPARQHNPVQAPVNEKVQTDADKFKETLTVPTPDENGIATSSVNVDVLFPPPKEMEGAWREASENPLLHDQFKRTGITGFSIEEPYKFGLSEQGNIDPKTGKIAINAAASNPTHTLAHEVAHDIYRRLTPENRATIDGYVKSATHIYPEHAGGLEERVMDHFADEIAHPMSASAPPSIRKIFFESPLEPRPAAPSVKAEVTPPEPKRPIYGTWSDVARNGGSLRMGDDIRGLVTKDGDFPLVLKDTFGARHVMPASVAADVLDSPAHNYVDQVFMAKDHIYDDATPKLEEDLSKSRKMLAANKFMGTEIVDGKMIQEATGPTLTDSYRKELLDQIEKGEKILADRKAGFPHRPVPVVPMDTLRTQSSGARMLTNAIKTFGNRDRLAQEYKAPELPAETPAAGKDDAEEGTLGDPIPPTEPENPSGGQDSNTATLEPNTSEKEGADQPPEPVKGGDNLSPSSENTPEQDKHPLTHVDRKDAPAEVKAWDADQANKWLGKSPALSIVSQQEEELDPKTLKTTQPWAGQFKLKQFEGMDAGTAPPIQVVRTEDGDWIVDGVHRATRAAKDGTKIRATVYSVKLPSADRTVNIPVAGGTTIKSAPVQRPVVAPVQMRVLPLGQVKALAAGLNPKSQQGQITNVRELMKLASERNPNRIIP